MRDLICRYTALVAYSKRTIHGLVLIHMPSVHPLGKINREKSKTAVILITLNIYITSCKSSQKAIKPLRRKIVA